MWVSKLNRKPAGLKESGGPRKRRAGIPAIPLHPAGWLWAALGSTITGNISLGLLGGSWGAGTDQDTSLHFHSSLFCQCDIVKLDYLMKGQGSHIHMLAEGDDVIYLVVEFRIMLVLLCHCLPGLLPGIIFFSLK